MNLYIKIKWRTALLVGTLLILTGVIGLFVPLVPEFAVILLGLWLLCAAVVRPLGRRRLQLQEEEHHNAKPLYASVVVTFLLATALYGCQERTPEPEKPTVTIEKLHTAYAKEVNRQQKYTRFATQAEIDRLPSLANLYRAVARSEEIHSANHAALLRGHGIEPRPVAKESVVVGNSLQTLKMALSHERAEVESLYPNLLQTAELEKYPDAVLHFKNTRGADVRHVELLKDALEKKGQIKKVQFAVCVQCGYILTSQWPLACPNCSAGRHSLETM